MGQSVHQLRWLGILIATAFVPFAGAITAQAGMIGLDRSPAVFLSIEDLSGTQLWTNRPAIAESHSASRDGWGLPPGLAHVIIDSPGHAPMGQTAGRGVPDLSILHNLQVSNDSAGILIFDFVSTEPVPGGFAAPNFIRGTITTSVIDGGVDGATLSNVADIPIYNAQIDGTTVRTMQSQPGNTFELIAPIAGSTAASESFGFEPNAVPVNVGGEIGIRLRFTLTPGDSAAILSRFDISAVPEPASLYAFAVALAVVGIRRKVS
jgi:hypothetical protein